MGDFSGKSPDMLECRQVHALLDRHAVHAAAAASGGRQPAKEFLLHVVAERSGRFGDISSPLFHFLQFYACGEPLWQCVNQSQLADAGDWIAWSLAAEIHDGQVQDLEVDRLRAITEESCINTWPGFLPSVAQWVSNFYYYARVRATMEDVARKLLFLWKLLFAHLVRIPTEGGLVDAVAMMVSWAAQNEPAFARTMIGQVERLVGDSRIPRQTRAKLVLVLTTRAAVFSSRSAGQWAEVALSDYRNELVEHESLQVLTACATGDKTDPYRDALLEAARQYRREHPISARDTLGSRRMWEARFDVFQPIIAKTLAKCQVEYLWTALAHWYGVNRDEATDPRELLFFAPFHHLGLGAVLGDECVLISGDRQELLQRVTETANEFYSVSTSVQGETNASLNVPERFGVPAAGKGLAFEHVLIGALAPEVLRPLSEKAAAQVMIGPCHPVQGVQLTQWGRTLPLVASIRQPLSDRQVRSVGIWAGGGSLTEQLELEYLVRMFRGHGIDVEVASEGNPSIEQFMAFYGNERFDVVWVSSHGEYDHWHPDEVKIQIGPEMFLFADSLIGQEPRTVGRRLLVLNICDGGRYADLGALPYVGFAPSMTAAHQATISHLWPVEGFSAAVFGAFLGNELTRNKGFFSAFCSAMLLMKGRGSNSAEVLTKAAGTTTELAQRLANREDDFSNIARCGSGVFFQ